MKWHVSLRPQRYHHGPSEKKTNSESFPADGRGDTLCEIRKQQLAFRDRHSFVFEFQDHPFQQKTHQAYKCLYQTQ